jgi:hypothetical protein
MNAEAIFLCKSWTLRRISFEAIASWILDLSISFITVSRNETQLGFSEA